MNAVYDFCGISRQAHHQQQRRQAEQSRRDESILDDVRLAREDHPRMGARKLFHFLQPMIVGINAFERLVAEAGLSVPRYRSQIRTTLRASDGQVLSNLTHGLKLNGINQLWVGDLSYLIDGSRTYYLVHLMDVYSRRLLGISISHSMKAEENLRVLNQSCTLRRQWKYSSLIHHSDAGAQYTSTAYGCVLAKAEITMSMAETCLQNPYSERLNGILKNEYLCVNVPPAMTLPDWQARVAKLQHLYNYQRPHQELSYRTPVAFEAYIAALPESQRPILLLHDFLCSNSTAETNSTPLARPNDGITTSQLLS